ncbi:peamaclein-like [Punica granatum]|uniref:Peamaclein-like n=2 Tax=Punica granatum TaxID=22663 RepID=A0A6P8CAN3_PUNGR|nr:peamaclein-like [Punica granatum]PKI71352.1 hypothetical protein CRG98_008211 [Punica granatum]
MNKLLFAILMCSFLLSSTFMEPVMASSVYCTKKCNERCGKAGVKDRCLKYCNICCAECKCVPSGTYGNKHQCPCYRDKKNSKGKPKCP